VLTVSPPQTQANAGIGNATSDDDNIRIVSGDK
jgi:hypothetical protein